MLLDQVFFYFLIGIGIILSLPALWLFVQAKWTGKFERLRTVADKSIGFSFLVGILPTLLIAFSIAAITKKVKSGDVGALVFDVLLLGAALTWALSGLAGLASLVGERLSSGGSHDPFKATLKGGVVLVCCFCMPFIGWFALLPMAIITGAGMKVRSRLVKTPKTAPEAAPMIEATA